MKTSLFFVTMLLVFLSYSCKKESPAGPDDPKPIDLPAKANEVISGSNTFGIDLFQLVAQEKDGNLMLSPLSASTALTMLLNGCGSQTYDQVRDMLGYDGLTLEEINAVYNSLVNQLLEVDPQVNLSLANAAFYRKDYNIKPTFLDAMHQSFDADITGLDFSSPSALETINGWAEEHTNGKIPKVLDKIDPDAVMFLMNALYFKGTWTYKFKQDSYKAPFFPDEGGEIEVVYMNDLFPVKTYLGSGCKVAELPYGNRNFAMVLIVPEGTLTSYLENFDESSWSAIIEGLEAISQASDILMIMPRFRFSYDTILNDQLKALGMIDAFDPGLADLSGISDNGLYVNFVKQNTFVEVNEDGTEAAAVTTIGIYETVSLPPETFAINKPFIFAIRERLTNTLLFIGKVEMPAYD